MELLRERELIDSKALSLKIFPPVNYPLMSVEYKNTSSIDLSENSKASLFKALKQNFDICVKT